MTRDEAIQEIKEASDSEVRHGDTVYHYDEVMKRVEAFGMAIKALEQTRWVHVSERLPKEAESVLIYAERNAYDDKGKFRKKVIDIGWQVDGRWHIDGCSGVDGIAWMSLPKPYKAESEDKE